MFYEDDRVRAAAERVARLETWQKLETDPAKREEIGRALADARETFKAESERAAKEKAEREAAEKAKAAGKNGQMFPDGNVTDFLKAFDKADADKKAAEGAAVNADKPATTEAKPESATADVETAKELERLRELEPPKEITALPEFKELYEAKLAEMAAEAEELMAEITAGDRDAKVDQVPELEPGAEVSGTVETIERRDDVTIYIVRDEEGLLTALHDDAKEPKFPELEPGDAIAASRDRDDGEYHVNEDHDFGM